MDLIAKRKLRDTWRQAVAARAATNGNMEICLSRFDELVRAGMPDGEAAFAVLRDVGLLWPITSDRDLPADVVHRASEATLDLDGAGSIGVANQPSGSDGKVLIIGE